MKVVFNEAAIKPQRHIKELLNKFSIIIERGVFLHDHENELLLKKLKKIFKSRFVILTSSGHSALQSVFTSLFLRPTDEVIFPVNAYPTAFPIALSQAKPIPVDVDQNGLIDLQEVEKKITKKTKAVVAVHLYGLSVDLSQLKKILRKRKITLIEDCAQAFGTTYKGKPVGTFGEFACFSFYPTKNLATLGDGGALVIKSRRQYRFLKKLISYGEKLRYKSEFVAGHSRLPELQAGVLNEYLRTFASDIRLKKRVRNEYITQIKNYKLNQHLRMLFHKNNSEPVSHLLIIETKKRDVLKQYLSRRGIESSIHYPLPIHLVPAFSYLKYRKGSFPMAERLSKTVLSLPFHSYLQKKEVEYVVKNIAQFYHA